MGRQVGASSTNYCAVLSFSRLLGPVPHDTNYYAKCMLGGALACGVTHAGITPLDVAKCNMQVSRRKYIPIHSLTFMFF